MRKKALFFVIFLLSSFVVNAQDAEKVSKQIDSLTKRLEKVEDKIVNIGVSIGYRRLTHSSANSYYEPSISAIDTTLQFQKLDPTSMVLSTDLVINPFAQANWIKEIIKGFDLRIKGHRSKNELAIANTSGMLLTEAIQRLSFIISINLVDFQSASSEFKFNKQFDGGIGLGIKLHPNCWLGWTYDIIQTSQLRDYVKTFENQKLIIDKKVLTQLDSNDNRIFYKKNLNSNTFKIIVKF